MSAVAIVGSYIWPSPEEIDRFVSDLEPGTVVITSNSRGAEQFAIQAARKHGHPFVEHAANAARYDSPLCYHERNKAIIADIKSEDGTLVAFAAKDPKTKRITAGTQMILTLAERAGVPTKIVETPVPAKLCDTIAKLRGRFENVRGATMPSQRQARIASASGHFDTIVAARDTYFDRLSNGWDEIDQIVDPLEADRLTDIWLSWLAVYRVLADVVNEAEHVFSA